MCSDRSQLANVANGAKAVLQTDKLDAVTIVATSTTGSACDRAGITVTLPKPMTSGAKLEGRSASRTSSICLRKMSIAARPASGLTFHYVNEENGQKLRRYWTNACGNCAIKHRCTTGIRVAPTLVSEDVAPDAYPFTSSSSEGVHSPSLWLQIQFRVLDHLTPLVMLGTQECLERRRRTANRFDHLLEKNLTQS